MREAGHRPGGGWGHHCRGRPPAQGLPVLGWGNIGHPGDRRAVRKAEESL